MHRRIAIYLLVALMAVPMVASTQLPPIIVNLLWDAPTTLESGAPLPPELMHHYNLYVCDASIIAGGPNSDDPMLGSVECLGNLKVTEVIGGRFESRYDASSEVGTLYFRISLVLTNGTQAKLGKELTYPFDMRRAGTVDTLRLAP